MSVLQKTEPEVVEIRNDGEEVVMNLHVSETLDYFHGHFPEAPILAGVVQLDWAVKFGKQYLGFGNEAVKNLEVLKFQVVILPGADLVLRLKKLSPIKFSFKYESGKGTHASGRVLLEDA